MSALHRIVECPGSVPLCEPHKDDPPSEEAIEGHAADWVAEQFALGNDVAEGVKAPNGITVDAEMILGARIWARVVRRPNAEPMTQMPIPTPRIHETHAGGTPDSYAYDPNTRTLYVDDYKYGHRYVEAFENWQLAGNASGLIDLLGLDDNHTMLEGTIVQPRSYHPEGPVRTWRVLASDIRAMMNVAHGAAHAALTDKAYTHVGTHCADCDARAECRTLQRAAMNILDLAGAADRVALDADALGRELNFIEHAADLLKARQTGLAAQVEAMLRNGKPVPYYGLKPGRSNLTWKIPPEEVAALGEIWGIPLRKPVSVITPTQAKDLGLDESVSKAYCDRPPAALKLTRLSLDDSRKIFANNTRTA